ncbi:glycerophosphodiester phosphodiesterase family protein [Oharaeibacter diazotrophicus]|uniref:Glycerophosphoryl diester phosphodiesterase n=1 Tax=Oharaeibacter diazotrophicus TaxID=1920512 RepID=A0A4R6RKM7_9HYPH|nr:glycerophosphodiester phosphodiesterase family protein [Oharaeibacter diazotrophicus]TDP86497.1 glycerophosphoryl diester phosphodiesterase [Oharaeibacter diazotrophicus]BBE71561.1 glycerophosphoryl diester phosphodiesterase [Pleomorphomonas sp. SM30]GLS78321.1 glycerophosphoryl diester phosphodiesterase [Oharaeibacter diazotrophicus]
MSDLGWLTARPVAHRGFHDAAAGRIENTLSAVAAAADRGFSIEIDVHLSADGEVFVFHDDTLDRLTEGHGPTAGLAMADLRKVPFKATADRIPALDDVLDLVAGRSTLVIEVKSRFGARQRDLVEAVAAKLARYDGPVAVMSFDPRMVEDFGVVAPALVRGIVADDARDPHDYGDLDDAARADLAALAHRPWSGFQFVGYWVDLLPNAIARRVREEWRLPLLTWTVRNPAARATAAAHADQMIFEGFDPEA